MSCEYDENCEYEKPLTGPYDTGVPSLEGVLFGLASVGIIIKDVISFVIDKFSGDPMFLPIITRVAELGMGIGAAVIIWVMWYEKCQKHREGLRPCLAGIVDSLTPQATYVATFEAAADIAEFMEKHTDIFPFMKEHPCFNLVVRCEDWSKIANNTGYLWPNAKGEPFISCYRKNPTICAKLLTAAVGATIGGIGGIAAGFWADVTALAICGASIFCGIFAIIIGAIVALVCALVGAKIGYEIGGTGQVSSGEPQQSTQPIRVGDYVAVRGNMVQLSWLHNANALWFVEEWCWYDHVDEVLPPYTHKMAKDFFQTEDQQDKAYLFCKMGIKE